MVHVFVRFQAQRVAMLAVSWFPCGYISCSKIYWLSDVGLLFGSPLATYVQTHASRLYDSLWLFHYWVGTLTSAPFKSKLPPVLRELMWYLLYFFWMLLDWAIWGKKKSGFLRIRKKWVCERRKVEQQLDHMRLNKLPDHICAKWNKTYALRE
jgi:hypothetical protein